MICVPIASIGWFAAAIVFLALCIATHRPKRAWWHISLSNIFQVLAAQCWLWACIAYWNAA